MLSIKSYKHKKTYPIFKNDFPIPEKSSDLNENRTIRFSKSENHTVEVSCSYIKKFSILHFSLEERSRMCVYLLLLVFFFL